MKAVVTDPVHNDLKRRDGEFEEMWRKLGEEVLAALQLGYDPETTWCNIGVTHDADTTGKSVMHRTISLNKE